MFAFKRYFFFLLSVLFFLLSLGLKVQAADGSGACVVSPSQVIENTQNTLTFTFTAAETMDNGSITIAIPSGWSAPQGTSGVNGYTVASSTGTIGVITFSGQTITVPITALASAETITVVYGSGGSSSGARAPLTSGRGGSYPTSVLAKSSAGGVLTLLNSSPTIVIVARPTTDNQPPNSILTAPADNEKITSQNYTLWGSTIDAGGSTPAWVKVSIDGQWHEASVVGQNYSTWKYQWNNIVEGTHLIQVKSADWIGNNEIPGDGVIITADFSPTQESQNNDSGENGGTDDGVGEETDNSGQDSESLIESLQRQIIAIQEQILALLLQLIELYTG